MKYPLIYAIALLFRPLFFITTYFLGFQISEESMGFTIASIVLDLAIVVMFIKYISRSKIGKHTVFGLFFVLFMLSLAIFSYLRLQLNPYTLTYFIKYFTSLSIPFFLLGVMIDFSNKRFLFSVEKYLTIFSTIIIISFFYITITTVSDVKQLTAINSLNYQSIGYYLTFSGLIVFLYSFEKKNPYRILKLFTYILAFLLVVFTGARGPLVAFFLGTAAIAFFKSRKVFILILVVSFAFILLLNPIIDFLYKNFPSFSSGVIRGLSFLYLGRNRDYPLSAQIATRKPFYENALFVFGLFPYFGSGVGGFSYYSGVGIYPHNLFLELLSDYGLFGFLSFLIGVIYILTNILLLNKYVHGLIVIAFVYSLTQLLFSGSFLCTSELWFSFGAVLSFFDFSLKTKHCQRESFFSNNRSIVKVR